MTKLRDSIPGPVFTNPVHFFAFGLGSGVLPKAPGTFGTLVAIPFYLLLAMLPEVLYLACLVLAFLLGIYLCGRTSRDLGVHDHNGIVWDEFVGFWITMTLTEPAWYRILGGFILFRLFDIFKPFPINWLDRQVKGGLGIMLDDVLAGIYAFLVLQLIILLTGF